MRNTNAICDSVCSLVVERDGALVDDTAASVELASALGADRPANRGNRVASVVVGDSVGHWEDDGEAEVVVE